MRRSVILFPQFNNMEIINEIREKYDPLSNCISPHISIVFPFESNITSNELKKHFSATLNDIRKFRIQLSGFTGDFRDGYLFLNVKKGNDDIIKLHDRLYTGILEKFLFKKVIFCPHLTVGRVPEPIAFDKAIEELAHCSESFETVIDKVYVENIDEIENSIIEYQFEFKPIINEIKIL